MKDNNNSTYQKRRVNYAVRRTSYQYEKDVFNLYQNKLYKSCIHGLNAFTEQEIKSMSFKERLDIINKQIKVQKIINKWKQEIINSQVNSFLSTLFHHSKTVKKLIEITDGYTDPSFICYQSFKELGLSKVDVAKKLIQENVLPKNFFQSNIANPLSV